MGKKEVLRIGIYCRISSDKKVDYSIKSQLKYGIEFCEKNGYEYEVFEDIISGVKVNRSGLNELVDKLYEKKLDGIWLWNWDRMIRDLSVMLFMRELVENSGCRVFVDNDEKDIVNDEGDIMDFEFRGMLSGMERRNIVRRMKSGMRRSLEEGRSFSGNIGIGYKKINKRVVVNEDEKELIIDCFEKYLNKSVRSYRDLVKLLKRKYGDELDVRINDKSLSRILKDEKYKGVYKLDYDGVGKYDINIGRIISDELFEKVNEKINKIKGKYRGNKKNEYLLGGKVVCGDCNNGMWIIGGNSYNYFKCKVGISEKKNSWDERLIADYQGCSSINDNKISLKKLEKVVWFGLFEVLSRSESIREEYFKKYKGEEINKGEFYGKMKYYEKEIEKEEKKKFGVLDKLMEGDISVDEKNILISGIEDKIDGYRKKYKEVSEEYDRVKIGDGIVNYVDRFLDDLDKKFELKREIDRRRVIEKYVDEVVVKRLGKNGVNREEYDVRIKLNLKDEKLLDEVENDKYINGDNKKNKGRESYNVYISNNKGLEIWRLQALYFAKIIG